MTLNKSLKLFCLVVVGLAALISLYGWIVNDQGKIAAGVVLALLFLAFWGLLNVKRAF